MDITHNKLLLIARLLRILFIQVTIRLLLRRWRQVDDRFSVNTLALLCLRQRLLLLRRWIVILYWSRVVDIRLANRFIIILFVRAARVLRKMVNCCASFLWLRSLFRFVTCWNWLLSFWPLPSGLLLQCDATRFQCVDSSRHNYTLLVSTWGDEGGALTLALGFPHWNTHDVWVVLLLWLLGHYVFDCERAGRTGLLELLVQFCQLAF